MDDTTLYTLRDSLDILLEKLRNGYTYHDFSEEDRICYDIVYSISEILEFNKIEVNK